MDDMPNTILSIVVVLIILAAGVTAFFMVYGGVGYTKEQTQTFGVTDPTTDEVVNLDYFPTSISSVKQYNGYSWVEIPVAGYTVDNKKITISNIYLEG